MEGISLGAGCIQAGKNTSIGRDIMSRRLESRDIMGAVTSQHYGAEGFKREPKLGPNYVRGGFRNFGQLQVVPVLSSLHPISFSSPYTLRIFLLFLH